MNPPQCCVESPEPERAPSTIAMHSMKLPQLTLAVVFIATSWLLPLSDHAAVFTNSLTIAETDTADDGQDIVISNTVVTINGPHSFNSLLLTNNAVLTHSACTASETHKLDLPVANGVDVSTSPGRRPSRSRFGRLVNLGAGNQPHVQQIERVIVFVHHDQRAAPGRQHGELWLRHEEGLPLGIDGEGSERRPAQHLSQFIGRHALLVLQTHSVFKRTVC